MANGEFMVGPADQFPPHKGHDGSVFQVRLWYPNIGDGSDSCVEVGLDHVRAADDIRVKYDFDRDGWVILQQLHYVDADGEPYLELVEGQDYLQQVEGPWMEVAFCKAWALEEKR